MFDLLPDVLMIFFEVFCCKIFFEIFGAVRCKGWVNAVQLILLAGCVLVFAKGLSDFFVLKQMSIIVVVAVFMFWHIKISMKTSLILAVLYQSLLLAVDYIAFLIYSGSILNGKAEGTQYTLENVLVVLLAK